MQEELYMQKLREAYEQLKNRPRSELIGIRRVLNYWMWPSELGESPVENWDELPHYRRPDMPEETVTKVTYLKPIADALLVLGVSHRDTVRE